MLNYIFGTSCLFWIGLVLFLIAILWLFCGGKNYEFVGLKPLTEFNEIRKRPKTSHRNYEDETLDSSINYEEWKRYRKNRRIAREHEMKNTEMGIDPRNVNGTKNSVVNVSNNESNKSIKNNSINTDYDINLTSTVNECNISSVDNTPMLPVGFKSIKSSFNKSKGEAECQRAAEKIFMLNLKE
jgi:hypothetical protein